MIGPFERAATFVRLMASALATRVRNARAARRRRLSTRQTLDRQTRQVARLAALVEQTHRAQMEHSRLLMALYRELVGEPPVMRTLRAATDPRVPIARPPDETPPAA